MKKQLLFLATATLLSFALLMPSSARAQFVNGSDYGPEIGLGLGYGGGIMVGGMFEAPITNARTLVQAFLELPRESITGVGRTPIPVLIRTSIRTFRLE